MIAEKSDYCSLKEGILRGSLSITSIVSEYLDRIKEKKDLNAYITVFDEWALKQAEEVEEKIKRGEEPVLAGLIVGVKDNICVAEKPVTCGSKMLREFISVYDATVISRLKEAGAIIIGKTNMDEFAMGSSTETSAFGPALNPHNTEHVPGGSSGGSAAAVAADIAMAALGSDTGGSIRQPASFTGIYGLKPTYGRVSRYGCVAFASSFDQIGPFARSVRDIALLLKVLAGHDQKDSTSVNIAVPDYHSGLSDDISGIKIGIPREYFSPDLRKEVKTSIEKSIDLLKDMGAVIKEVSLSDTDYAIAAYYILTTAEASSNLARFDGAHYGFRSGEADDLTGMYVKSRSEGFGDEVKRRIMIGTFVLSSGYYDAYYRKAQKVRRIIKEDFDKAFSQVDCIVTPTVPTTAFKLGEKTDPLQMYLTDIFTTSANLTGIPGINVPCGNNESGLPIGLQLLGKHFDEQKILNIALALENNC